MRFIVSWESGEKDFPTYQKAFQFYMKLREEIGFDWLYVYDNQKQEYLICENCYCK